MDKNLLVSRIKNINNYKCYIKIFKVLCDDNIQFTKNSNGIYFVVNNINEISLNKIERIVRFYEDKKKLILSW